MTISLTGTGGLFTRLGKIGLAINAINAFRGTSGSPNIATMINAVEAQFASTNQQLIDGLYTARDGHRSGYGSMLLALQTLARNTLITMADDDVKLPTKDIASAMRVVISQMVTSVDSIEKPTVTVTAAAGSANVGSGKLVVSVKSPYGVTRDYPFAEVIDFECLTDSQVSGTAGRETFSVKGDGAETDQLSWYFPRGSGANSSITAVDATEDAGSNKLRNSDFTDFTSNEATYWTTLVGTPGTDLASASAGNSLGSAGSALQFTGTGGSPLTSVAQTFNSSAGTTATLKPNTVYHVGVWIKKSASLLAGNIEIGLVDGSNAAVADDATTANTLSVAHGAIATSYGFHSMAFITPKSLPSTAKLRIRVSTALTSGESVYIDHPSLAEATLVYPGGPYATIHSHPTAFIVGDTFTCTTANNYAGLWAVMLERLFSMRQLGLQVPSVTGAAETIADSLLT